MQKIPIEHPKLFDFFRAHLSGGNSMSSFRKYLKENDYRYFTKHIMKEPRFALLKQDTLAKRKLYK